MYMAVHAIDTIYAFTFNFLHSCLEVEKLLWSV